MVKFRIIPWIEVKGSNLVKGINMEGLRVLGTPYKFSDFYSENGADELIYYDVVASLYGRKSILDIISKTASKTFIPITVSGGIRNVDDIKKVLGAGADRVGSSTICINIQTMKDKNGKYYCYYNHGRELTNIEAKDWAKIIEKKGAGEIILSSIDREGSFEGIDIDLLKTIRNLVKIPVIMHGGCNGPENIFEAYSKTKFEGVAISGLFHYHLVKKFKKELIKDLNKKNKNIQEGNIEYLLKKDGAYSYIYDKTYSIVDFKNFLKKKDMNIRI